MAPRHGFTLIESLMATGVLLIIVTAVCLAVSSGQQHGYWAQQRIAGTFAADDLMARIQATAYDSLRTQWNGHEERPGEMVDANGNPLPLSFSQIGRDVEVVDAIRLTPIGTVEIEGKMVIVRAFDAHERTLVKLERFVPSPVPPASVN